MIVRIADKAHILCEVANTMESRSFGLRGCISLPEDRGLLFLFDDPGLIEMTMAGMSIPLDFIFLDNNSTVIKTVENVYPEEPYIYCADASAVIEVNAGFCKRHGVEIGDGVEKEIYEYARTSEQR